MLVFCNIVQLYFSQQSLWSVDHTCFRRRLAEDYTLAFEVTGSTGLTRRSALA